MHARTATPPGALLCLTCALVTACQPAPSGSASPEAAPGAWSAAQIVRDEALRSSGVPRLRQYLADEGAPLAVRALAQRALGRTGDDAGVAVLLAALEHPVPLLREHAALGLGLLPREITGLDHVESALLARFSRESERAVQLALLSALGRLAGPRALPTLAQALSRPDLAEHAAHALGNLGINQVSLDSATRDALFAALHSADGAHGSGAVHLAVAYALEREYQPADNERAVAALESLARAPWPEVRANAIRALARRDAGSVTMAAALGDDDWRVRARAARGLGASQAAGEVRARLVEPLLEEWDALVRNGFRGPRVHVITEALGALADTEPTVEAERLAHAFSARSAEILAQSQDPRARLVASTVHCQGARLAVRAGAPWTTLARCGGAVTSGMPVPERRALLADSLAKGFGGAAGERATAMLALLDDPDPHVRAHAMAALPALLAADERPAEFLDQALARVRTAIAAPQVDLAGNAVAAAAELAKSEREALAEAARASLGPALMARARELDDNSELAITLLDALAAMRAPGSEDACRGALTHENRTVREHARACASALSGQDLPAASAQPSAPMPGHGAERIDEAFLHSHPVLWLETTQGQVRIDLYPDTAPIHVAAIVALARAGFYTDLAWHRVVPDFVAQGGDPTGTGWGGPGFQLPAEPWWRPFARGAVGIADAGLDTGGSQLFIMHSRAHRLDGRYTLIGQVMEGQDVVDSLMVGDRIVSARVQ